MSLPRCPYTMDETEFLSRFNTIHKRHDISRMLSAQKKIAVRALLAHPPSAGQDLFPLLPDDI